MGVATGCGFKEIYRFPHTTYPYSSCICTFLQQHPYFFVHFVYRSRNIHNKHEIFSYFRSLRPNLKNIICKYYVVVRSALNNYYLVVSEL